MKEFKRIAVCRSLFPTKFGIPRQSGLVDALKAQILFEPEYRNPDALRGLDSFSHIWLIWSFSKAERDDWSPTVRPPRLGGNTRMGVFATRSPFRPNAIGLSAVRLERIEWNTGSGPVLHISGADLMDGTPIYDIKPYLRYTDCHPEAEDGYTEQLDSFELDVDIPELLLKEVPEVLRESLIEVLRHDPRPSYQRDPDRVYGFIFAGLDIRFTVRDGLLTVCEIGPGQ